MKNKTPKYHRPLLVASYIITILIWQHLWGWWCLIPAASLGLTMRPWFQPSGILVWRRPTDYRHGDDAWISSPMTDVMYAVASVDGEFWTAAVAVGCYNPYELWFDGVTVREARQRCEEHWAELKRNGYGKNEN